MRTLSGCSTCDLVPWPGVQPRPPAMGSWRLSLWAIGKVPAKAWFWCDCAEQGMVPGAVQKHFPRCYHSAITPGPPSGDCCILLLSLLLSLQVAFTPVWAPTPAVTVVWLLGMDECSENPAVSQREPVPYPSLKLGMAGWSLCFWFSFFLTNTQFKNLTVHVLGHTMSLPWLPVVCRCQAECPGDSNLGFSWSSNELPQRVAWVSLLENVIPCYMWCYFCEHLLSCPALSFLRTSSHWPNLNLMPLTVPTRAPDSEQMFSEYLLCVIKNEWVSWVTFQPEQNSWSGFEWMVWMTALFLQYMFLFGEFFLKQKSMKNNKKHSLFQWTISAF